MAFSVSYLYVIQDKYSRKLDKIRKSTDRFDRSAKKTTSRVALFAKKMGALRTALAGSAAVMAAAFPVKQAIDFEFAMSDVLKVLDDITPKQLQALEKQVFTTSIAMGKLPKNIAAVVAAGGRLGIPLENLGAFTRLASKVGVAFDITDEIAGDSLASITDKLGLTINRTGDLMDAINHLADNTSAKAGGMIEIIGRISGTMKTVEMPPELIAGWAALADRVEVTPRLAASGMKMMMRAMKGMPGMMEKLLKAPSKTMSDYLKTLAKIDKRRLPRVLEKKFGAEAAGFVEKLVGKMHLLDQTLGLVADKTKVHGSMQRELNKKLGTTKVLLRRLKSLFSVILIKLGNKILPFTKKLDPLISKMERFVMGGASAELTKLANAWAQLAESIQPVLIAFDRYLDLRTPTISWLDSLALALGAVADTIELVLSPFVAFTSLIDGLSRGDISGGLAAAGRALKKGIFFGEWAQPKPVSGGVAGKAQQEILALLSGNIDFTSDIPGKVKATFESSLPGNLGVNMQTEGPLR